MAIDGMTVTPTIQANSGISTPTPITPKTPSASSTEGAVDVGTITSLVTTANQAASSGDMALVESIIAQLGSFTSLPVDLQGQVDQARGIMEAVRTNIQTTQVSNVSNAQVNEAPAVAVNVTEVTAKAKAEASESSAVAIASATNVDPAAPLPAQFTSRILAGAGNLKEGPSR